MVHDLKPGLRGLLAAGLFATAMGSLSTALNALATSFTRDWYLGVFPAGGQRRRHNCASPAGARSGSRSFWRLVGIGTAALKLANPELRIIPIVLGSFGYTYGSLLGVFLIGMLTKTRGTCRGNVLAMACGLLATLVLSGAHNDIYDILHEKEARVRRAVVAVAKESKTPLKVVTVADAMALDDAGHLVAIAKRRGYSPRPGPCSHIRTRAPRFSARLAAVHRLHLADHGRHHGHFPCRVLFQAAECARGVRRNLTPVDGGRPIIFTLLSYKQRIK